MNAQRICQKKPQKLNAKYEWDVTVKVLMFSNLRITLNGIFPAMVEINTARYAASPQRIDIFSFRFGQSYRMSKHRGYFCCRTFTKF